MNKKFKINSKILKSIFCFALIIALFTAFFCMLLVGNAEAVKTEEKVLIEIWQIDNFEGGKGSRADYLQKCGDRFSENENCYITVKSLSSAAVRANLKKEIFPDLISYGAGIYGIETFIENRSVWCNGGYCLLTLDKNSDFSDANKDNTVLNAGTENLSSAAALFCGLNGALAEKPQSAYLKLINGGCKYLLGTQRDVFRLRTREVGFTIKPLSEFNDLYQNISVVSKSGNKEIAAKFIGRLLSESENLKNIGMLCENKKIYDDELSCMENIEYKVKIKSPLSLQARENLLDLIGREDINSIKNLFN